MCLCQFRCNSRGTGSASRSSAIGQGAIIGRADYGGWTTMVHRLRLSLEQLAPPICPNCRAEVRSFRCTLVALEPLTVAHLCPRCNRVANTVRNRASTPPTSSVPRRKLSAPRVRRLA
jgi:hypothetical protein